MELSTAEVFLGTWAIFATILWQIGVYKYDRFLHLTVWQLQRLANGQAKLVDTGSSIEIHNIKEENDVSR